MLKYMYIYLSPAPWHPDLDRVPRVVAPAKRASGAAPRRVRARERARRGASAPPVPPV